MAVFLFVVKVGAENWRAYGNVLGTNEIVQGMFGREVLVLMVADAVMCGVTGMSWVLQRVVRRGWLDWDGMGWVLQSVWEVVFVGAAIELTLVRDWPWTHTVFFVMHGIVMLMKQHSYAFYNGYLAGIYKRKGQLEAKLKELEGVSPAETPSNTEPTVEDVETEYLEMPPSAFEYKERRRSMPCVGGDIDRIAAAITSEEPLDGEQIRVFERILKWEVDAITDELRGKAASTERAYPKTSRC